MVILPYKIVESMKNMYFVNNVMWKNLLMKLSRWTKINETSTKLKYSFMLNLDAKINNVNIDGRSEII